MVLFRITRVPAIICVAAVSLAVPSNPARAQQFKEDVGFNRLASELGAAVPDGTGVTVMQTEAESPMDSGRYLPDSTVSEFSGKVIADVSAIPAMETTSGHATSVGRRLYGNDTSMTPGITSVSAYHAGDFLNNVLSGVPMPLGVHVGNHSYIASTMTDAEATAALSRFDHLIHVDNSVMVVGVNNGSGNSTPQLLAPSYNAISVGRTDGNHSRGATTTSYGSGRIKPDIVAPQGSSSNATALVASAAAMLRQSGAATPNAIQNEVIKATLFAGATKGEFGDWDRTSTRPIDEVYGFGELNVYNSYHIQQGGEFNGATVTSAGDIGEMGWDYGDFNGTDSLLYNFEIMPGGELNELSAALVWNAEITDQNANPNIFDPAVSVANLDLRLYDANDPMNLDLLDESVSTEYNLEHIYANNLAAGDYLFEISGNAATDFGLAWRITAVPEPSAALLASALMGCVSMRRRRHRPTS